MIEGYMVKLWLLPARPVLRCGRKLACGYLRRHGE